MRPGVIDVRSLADKLDGIASFYAAYGPADDRAWKTFFEECAPHSRGTTPSEIPKWQTPSGQTCGALFENLASSYRIQYVPNEDAMPTRLDDRFGQQLTTLVVTSVLQNDAVSTFERARTKHRNSESFEFDVSFDDVAFGYRGRFDALDRIERDRLGYGDAKDPEIHVPRPGRLVRCARRIRWRLVHLLGSLQCHRVRPGSQRRVHCAPRDVRPILHRLAESLLEHHASDRRPQLYSGVGVQ